MKAVFLDTSFLLALEIASDQNHRPALEYWQSIKADLPVFVTTSYVFNEVVTFFNTRGHHNKALQVGHSLLASSHTKLIHVDEALFFAGWEVFQLNQDKDYSLTDCISFVVMRLQKISTALTFDSHYVQAMFQKAP